MLQQERVPVMSGLRCIELACPERVRQILKSPNARAIKRRHDRQVVEIQVSEFGDDRREPARQGNPQAYIHDSETETNPANNWALKSIPDRRRPAFESVARSVINRAA